MNWRLAESPERSRWSTVEVDKWAFPNDHGKAFPRRETLTRLAWPGLHSTARVTSALSHHHHDILTVLRGCHVWLTDCTYTSRDEPAWGSKVEYRYCTTIIVVPCAKYSDSRGFPRRSLQLWGCGGEGGSIGFVGLRRSWPAPWSCLFLLHFTVLIFVCTSILTDVGLYFKISSEGIKIGICYRLLIGGGFVTVA